MQYIQFEEYGISTGMNGNGRMLVDGNLWMEVYKQKSVDENP
jgi:hypothetical protein